MPDSTPSKNPKRRWCQFSLLTLLVVMTVATVAFGGWVQYRRQRAQENRDRVAAYKETVAEVERLGGTVTSLWSQFYEDGRSQSWLEKQFDDPGVHDPFDILMKVFQVDLSGTRVSDDGLEHLKELTDLGGLYLNNTQVTDAGFEHLKGMSQLRSLSLRGTNVTDEGVQELQRVLPNCKISH
jgi:hypothetical protein